MIEVMGIKYITDKEAAVRYGYSKSWFTNNRWKKSGPKFVKMIGGAKIMYPLEETDKWFKDNMFGA